MIQQEIYLKSEGIPVIKPRKKQLYCDTQANREMLLERKKRKKKVLTFIYERMVNVHHENPDVDYMRTFKEMLDEM